MGILIGEDTTRRRQLRVILLLAVGATSFCLAWMPTRGHHRRTPHLTHDARFRTRLYVDPSSSTVNSTDGTLVSDVDLSTDTAIGADMIDDGDAIIAVDSPAIAQTTGVSRRDWLKRGAVLVGGAVVSGPVVQHTWEVQQNATSRKMAAKGRLAPINLTDVATQTKVNVSLECGSTCITLDTATYQKKKTINLPSWVPWTPPPVEVKDITNTELLTAGIVSGSIMEMGRTTLLYPLLTLKTRIQTDINQRQRRRNKRLHLKRRMQVLGLNIKRHFREGNLLAGLLPSLLVSVPASGIYYGVRDVAKRGMLPMQLNDLSVSLTAALLADVASLAIRTPADTLAIRLQVATAGHGVNGTDEPDQEEVDEKVGDWFVESLERLPAVILTDLPYLLSRIALYRLLIQGNVDLGRYELASISTALLCAFLTTPFDVARTRILVDSDADPTNGIDGGSGQGLVKTFRTIYNEGDGGIRNLFAGWLERTAYFGIGRAWLEPLQIVGYFALRDAILLEWFD